MRSHWFDWALDHARWINAVLSVVLLVGAIVNMLDGAPWLAPFGFWVSGGLAGLAMGKR